jgi:hypothetical protein
VRLERIADAAHAWRTRVATVVGFDPFEKALIAAVDAAGLSVSPGGSKR